MGIFTKREEEYNFLDYALVTTKSAIKIYELALERAVDLIAKTISKNEIKIFRYDSKTKKTIEKIDNVYYRLNVRPNSNEESSSFFYSVISNLLKKGESLIIPIKKENGVDYLYCVDEWNESDSILFPKIYSEITLSDSKGKTIKLDKTFNANDVVHLKLGNCKISDFLKDYYENKEELIIRAKDMYKKSNSYKWKLSRPGSQPKIKDEEGKAVTYEDYKNSITKGLGEDGDSIILLSDIFGLELLNKDKTKTIEDYDKLVKDIFDKVAMAYNIPLDIFYGNKTDKSTSTTDFITFAVLPIIEILEDGMNAKLLTEKDYLKGERITINKSNIKHFDVMDVASSMDKLFAMGYSFNQIQGFLGEPKIDEDWANEHHITKNYADVKGGELDGNAE